MRTMQSVATSQQHIPTLLNNSMKNVTGVQVIISLLKHKLHI